MEDEFPLKIGDFQGPTVDLPEGNNCVYGVYGMIVVGVMYDCGFEKPDFITEHKNDIQWIGFTLTSEAWIMCDQGVTRVPLNRTTFQSLKLGFIKINYIIISSLYYYIFILYHLYIISS